MGTVRLGAVDYLNARPLVYGLAQNEVRFDLPSACAMKLEAGEIDLGLIPSISYFDRPDMHVVPGIGIISDGPVASVAIFSRRPLSEVRTLALDTSSRTSVALTRVLCANLFRIDPEFVPHGPDLASMLTACDAALLIGDPALFVDYAALGAEKIDLGQQWTEWTGHPFVWAFWAGRAGAVGAGVIARLQSARDAGIKASDAIADRYRDGFPEQQAIARRYLRESIQYHMTDDALAGLRRFYREASALGLVGTFKDIRFFTD
jgi:chorismate dehydratase